MIVLPDINPEIIRIGPIAVRWYGMMYVFGFAAAIILGTRRSLQKRSPLTPEQFHNLIFYVLAGLIIGARLGYTLFYNGSYYFQHPVEILAVWTGGMSFHGGLIGVFCGVALFSYRNGLKLLDTGDFLVPLAPPGLFAGRVGNFINGELWGRPSDLPWAMVFNDPSAGGIARHPSQLYEASLEGIVLFSILWVFSSKPRHRGSVTGLFLLLYGLFRFLVEFCRQPDLQLGFIAMDWMTMGQLLSLPMIVIGAWLFIHSSRADHLSPHSANKHNLKEAL
jgi:phosphatidylglycerol---prolipoprotein diacylglyceryl transferase